MKIRYGLMSGLVLCFLGSVVFGQAPVSPLPGGGMGGGAMMGQAAPAPAPVEGEMLPGEKFDNVRLDDFLDYLKQKVTGSGGFNSVIVRAPGVPTDYPTLPSMTTKNVTIGQFLEFVKTSYPGVDIKRIDGPTAPLYVIRIENAEGQIAAGPPVTPGPDPTATQVMVFPLGKVIGSVVARMPSAGGADDQKKALDEVLSLVEAAMKEQSGGAPPTLQVHEATQTLLFKGTAAQLSVLVQVLQTLQPTGDDLNNLNNNNVLRAEARQVMQENNDLKLQLNALKRATTQPQK
jgi:hypothetical protein